MVVTKYSLPNYIFMKEHRGRGISMCFPLKILIHRILAPSLHSTLIKTHMYVKQQNYFLISFGLNHPDQLMQMSSKMDSNIQSSLGRRNNHIFEKRVMRRSWLFWQKKYWLKIWPKNGLKLPKMT